MNLAVLILTRNEERHIERALRSVAEISDEIVVVDSYSTDRTVEIATTLGARVLQNPFVNYAKQFQWGLDNGGITASWIMRLDADEVIEPALAAEIAAKLPQLPPEIAGVNLKRKHIFMGRWIRHGGRYPLILLRIWRNGVGRIEDRWMDEHIVLDSGMTVTFDGSFSDINLNDLTYFTDKHNKYSTREAIDAINLQLGLFDRDTALSQRDQQEQASIKRRIKEDIYNRIPYYISVPLYFIYRYIFQLGFLDGPQGLVYHFLQGAWYRFLVGAKVEELRRSISGLSDIAEIRTAVSELTGHDLTR